MANQNISNKILHWYDNNKRDLPWRKPKNKKQSEYFTLVSEVMLQQTQVSTVVPYFLRFIHEIPNLKILSKVNNNKLLKLWEGLGYYTRAKNLKKTAQLLVSKFKSKIPNDLNSLKKLPGIGDYTSKAILSLEFNKKVIPIDGNIERLIKRIFFLRTIKEIDKKNIIKKSHLLGYSSRQRDYVQSLMELGSLICKPKQPLCNLCPINSLCISFKKKNFEIIKKFKKSKTKYFEANIYYSKNKILLIKNEKYNFLKNHLIFPMDEINKYKFFSSSKIKTSIKISNIDMKIIINKNNKIPNKKGKVISTNKFKNEIIPSFTKKLFRVASSHQ